MAASQMFRSLRHRNARRFFVGMSFSMIGTWVQSTAMNLVVYRLTGRATDVGITLLCQFLPMLVLGVWAGGLADRVNKRRMAITTQSMFAAQAIALGILDLTGVLSLPVLYAMSFGLGVIGAIDNPARRGFVVELVEPADIPNVLALNTAVMTGSRIFGPALAAMLVRPLGSGWLFVVNGLSFLAILVPMVRADVSLLHPAPPAPRGGQPVREALRFVRRSPRLWTLFVAFTLVGTFAFNYGVSLLKLADVRFGDENLFGWLLAMVSVGSLIGSLVSAGRPRMTTAWFVGSVSLLGASGLALSWAPSVWIAYVLAVPVGAAGGGVLAAFNGISQTESPPEMRGRLLALGAVAFLGTTPIGAPVTGWVADRVSAEWSLGYGSALALAIGGYGAVALRRSRAGAVPAGEHEPATA
jgi:MFS family permease